MKKAAIVLCSIFIFSSLSFAMNGGKHDGRGMTPADKKERSEKMMAMKKDFMEFHKKLEALLEKYNKASDKKKDAVVKEIKELVSEQTDKDLTKKKEMLAIQKERIAEFEKKINEIEADKEAYVNKKVDLLISEEGQLKFKEMCGDIEKREYSKDKHNMKNKKGDKEFGDDRMPPPPPPFIDEEPVR